MRTNLITIDLRIIDSPRLDNKALVVLNHQSSSYQSSVLTLIVQYQALIQGGWIKRNNSASNLAHLLNAHNSQWVVCPCLLSQTQLCLIINGIQSRKKDTQ